MTVKTQDVQPADSDMSSAASPAPAARTLARMWAWFDRPGATYWILAFILLAGAYLRLSHLNWDQGTHVHPDENFLTMVTSAMRLPTSVKEFFDSTTSPMNPYNNNFGLFVYGTLPLFIVRIVAEGANRLNQVLHFWMLAPGVAADLTSYGGVYLVGRAVSALFDLGSVGLLFVLGRRLFGRRVGLLAAALYAFAALPLQQSHFYTVDTVATFFALVTFYLAVRVAQGGDPNPVDASSVRRGGWVTYLMLGASLGATVACRINLAPLVGIAVLAAGIRAWDDWRSLSSSGGQQGGRFETALVSTMVQAIFFRLVLMGVVAIAVFRMAQPYAFGGTSLLDFSLSPKWLSNMSEISRTMKLDVEMPPTHQWANRTPFVYLWVNMVVWGMGVPLGVIAWAGWLMAFWQVLRLLTLNKGGAQARSHILPVFWIGGMFLWQGMQAVQSMRYVLPLYPLLAMMAAWFLWWLVDRARSWTARAAGAEAGGARRLPWPQLLSSGFRGGSYVLLAAVAIATMLWGWGFTAIYRRPLTRVTASRWMYANIPSGSHIGVEDWDEALPLGVDGRTGYGSGYFFGLTSGQSGAMSMAWEDTTEKRDNLYQWLNEADYLVVSSNRRWAWAPRMPLRFPMTTEYYRRLFAGELGFKQVLHVSSFITVFGHQFNDNSAEEAFSVYDHPQVFVFQKTPDYSETPVRSYLDAIDLEQVIPQTTKQVSAAPTALMLTADEVATQQAGGTWTDIFDQAAPQNRSQAISVLLWLLLVEALGLIAFPLAFVVLRSLGDRGYGVAKTLGILLLAWLSWFGPGLKIVPYQRWWILLCLGLLAGASAAVAWRRRDALRSFIRARLPLLLTEEALFLVLFGLFLLIRIGNPDLWHPARGGEKPMEFAFLNAVIRSTTFPPYDPWFAGGFMNYYYFGWVIVGTLVKLTGIVPWVAYNLAVPTLFALTGIGAFSVAFNLADGDRGTEFPGEEAPYGGLRIGSLLAGLAAVLLVVIVGNLGNAKLLWDQVAAHASSPAAGTGVLAGILNFFSGAIALVTGQGRLEFPNDWWFWNASRVIPDTINEFPFFTFTYADLHAHMIVLPLTLLALAVAVALVRNVGVRGRGSGGSHEPSPWCIAVGDLLPILLLGLVLGALRATNTWDFPTYTLIALVAIVITEVARRPHMAGAQRSALLQDRLAFLFRAAVAIIWRLLIVVVVSAITFYPFTKTYATAYAGLQMWNEAKTQLSDFMIVWGFFVALAVIWLAAELAEQLRRGDWADWLLDLLPWIVGLGVVLIGAGWVLKIRIWLVLLPLAFLAVILALGREVPPARRFALLLLALAAAIVMGIEVVRQKDDIGRMNTVFKFGMQAWTLFGVSTAFGLASWAPRALRWRPGWRRLAWAAAGVLFVLVMLYPAFAARAKVRDRFSDAASPHGLDGMAYMDKAIQVENNQDVKVADDQAAMLWLLNNVSGSPVILEAQLPEYRWGSRFSVYTGLPTVQGWNWHERQQRSVVPAVVERRVSQVQELYNTTDIARAQHLLDTYNVRYIIVGGLERATYTAEGLAKFDALAQQGDLRVVYQGGAVTIYEIAGRAPAARPAAPAAPLPAPDTFRSPQP